MSDDEQMKSDDLDEQEAAVLPAHEAMSLITPVGTEGVASDPQGSVSAEESSGSEASNQDTDTSIT